MVDPVVNKGKVTVSTGYNDTATSIVLATGQGAELPDPVVDGAYNLPWWDSTNYNDPADDPNFEIVRVTGPAGTGDTKTIVRAQEGTAATNKNNADATYKMHLGVTAKTITDLIADVEKAATVIVGKSGHVDYLTTDYGSDDACIQAAIDYVNGIGGGSILIREGTYTLNNTVNIKGNIILFGVGKATQITFDSDDDMISCASGVDLEDVTIADIYFHGTQTNSAHNEVGKTAYIINLETDCYNVKIIRCTFDHSSNFGIGIGNGSYLDGKRITIKDNYMYNCRAGILTNSRNVIVSHNYLIQDLTTSSGEGIDVNNVDAGSSYYGTNDNMSIVSENIIIGFPQDSIDITGSEGIVVSDNYMIAKTTAHASGDPWVAINGGQRNIIKNNYIEGFKEGIRGFSYSIISGNLIKNAKTKGIDAASQTQIKIIDNEILLIADTSAGRSINAFQLTDSTISNNLLIDIGYWGIYVSGASNLIIANNSLKCVSGAVVVSLIKGSLTYSQIMGNSLVGNSHSTGYGIMEFGSGVMISNNRIQNVNTPLHITGTPELIINNIGYNPVGAVGPPSVPATTVNYTNAYGYPCQVQVYGGTVTEIDIDDIATGLTSGIFTIPPGGTINITYSAAPSWRWWGL